MWAVLQEMPTPEQVAGVAVQALAALLALVAVLVAILMPSLLAPLQHTHMPLALVGLALLMFPVQPEDLASSWWKSTTDMRDTTLNIGIEMDQGADFALTIGVYGEGGPLDLTGYSFLSEMKSSTNPATTAVATFQFTLLDQAAQKGKVQMTMSQATINAIVTSLAVPLTQKRLTTPFLFDVKMKDTLGKSKRIIKGLIFISPQATERDFT
jgi:hypothetical protein